MAANNSAVSYSATQPWIGVAPMRIQMLESYHACLETVCAEGIYLMSSCAPELEKSREFVQTILDDAMPMFVAFVPGPKVVGWCDMYRPSHACQEHVGRIGMGIHSDFREQGLGTVLLERVLKMARLRGIERAELDCFSSNSRAIALYEKFGFETEGAKRRARKTKDGYEDILIMARIFELSSVCNVNSDHNLSPGRPR